MSAEKVDFNWMVDRLVATLPTLDPAEAEFRIRAIIGEWNLTPQAADALRRLATRPGHRP